MNTDVSTPDATEVPQLRLPEEMDGWGVAPQRPFDEGDHWGRSTWLVTGRLVSLQFIRSALRRHRLVWLATALVGLLIGVGYHVLVPLRYSATATVYLVHPNTSGQAIGPSGFTAGAQNDAALLDTSAVAKRAIALLREPGLSPGALLGPAPATLTSDNLLTVTVAGPSPREAARRVDAVVDAYLSFRAEQYARQNRAILGAERQQLSELQKEAASLSAKIAALPSRTPAIASLVGKQSALTPQITSLEGSIQQGVLDTLAVSRGSKVLTPGTATGVSMKKVVVLDGLTGLAGGLGVGMVLVAVIAVLSDRPRRREDIAGLLGAPVELSVPRLHRHRLGKRSLRKLATGRNPAISLLAHRLSRHTVSANARPSVLLVVAIDDAVVPGAALLALAREETSAGGEVLLVDATGRRMLGRALRAKGPGYWAEVVPGSPVDLVVPGRPWEPEAGIDVPEDLGDVAETDSVLVLATVDPSLGADHVRRWSREAVVTVTAGGSSVERIAATGELLEAAGVAVTSVVLLGADRTDESVGLPTLRSTHGAKPASVAGRVL